MTASNPSLFGKSNMSLQQESGNRLKTALNRTYSLSNKCVQNLGRIFSNLYHRKEIINRNFEKVIR